MDVQRLYGMSVAVVVAAVAVVGCAAAPEPEPAQLSTTARTKCTVDCPPPPPPRCFYGYQLNNSPFERDLAALGCGGKVLWQSSGGGLGWFFTSCSTLTTVYDWCPSDGAYTTMDVWRLASCYTNDPVVQALTDIRSPCTGAESPEPIVLWDPTCGGTRCLAPW